MFHALRRHDREAFLSSRHTGFFAIDIVEGDESVDFDVAAVQLIGVRNKRVAQLRAHARVLSRGNRVLSGASVRNVVPIHALGVHVRQRAASMLMYYADMHEQLASTWHAGAHLHKSHVGVPCEKCAGGTRRQKVDHAKQAEADDFICLAICVCLPLDSIDPLPNNTTTPTHTPRCCQAHYAQVTGREEHRHGEGKLEGFAHTLFHGRYSVTLVTPA
jgi:hypothetical protein